MKPGKKNKASLDDLFRFTDDSFPGALEGWQSQLRPAVGVMDGERYLLRVFRKTGTPLDDDLRRLIARGLRRIRRVLSSRRSRDLLVEVREVVEDENEFAIVILDPGSPLASSSRAMQARKNGLLSVDGRKRFWRNISRIAEALAACHDAGIVHGAVSEGLIFSHGDAHEDYRLGGYEACVHIADGDTRGPGPLLRSSGAISFRQDWMDLGRTAASLLGVTEDGGPPLLSIERRMLDRLSRPPVYQLFDGSVVLRELHDLSTQLESSGSSSDGGLLLYPSVQVIRSDFAQLTSGAVPASDFEALMQFVADDLRSLNVRAVSSGKDTVRLFTDLASYEIKVNDDRIGTLVKADKRRLDDLVFHAVTLSQRVHLCRNRNDAEDRARKLGPGAIAWANPDGDHEAHLKVRDVVPWYALILLEAFTCLREQFRIYPFEVLPSGKGDEPGTVWLAPREEAQLDERRRSMGMRPAEDAVRRELRDDDGKTIWTIDTSDSLTGGRERPAELRYAGSSNYHGRQAFEFYSDQPVVAGSSYYLRPRREKGTESAIRRRLQNIVAARSNVELLRSLDDPALVALDDALQEVAAPGEPPADLDASKAAAWKSIASGKSINIVVGPPGVGKTYLISQLVRSILVLTRDARILISAQNHETLVQMEDELKRTFSGETTIIVRVERSAAGEKATALRDASQSLLQATGARNEEAELLASQNYTIRQALNPVNDAEKVTADRVFRDTDNLLLRSSDITLATTSSYVIEEMIRDGEQFDWVIIEEAARANGSELIGALLLGNRRIMIGDHRQLSPFDVIDRQKFYDISVAQELLKGARKKLADISDLPLEVDETLKILETEDVLLANVLANAARFEEAFRSIAEREEEREKENRRPSSFANILLEQSRMHPAISELVSNCFYERRLQASERVKNRKLSISSGDRFPKAPIVVLDTPALSVSRKRAYEQMVGRSYRNATEAAALYEALQHLRPVPDESNRVSTLVALSPYAPQVRYLESLIKRDIDPGTGLLFGFESPRKDARFVYTSDSFQGGEADVVLASLVRNNSMVGGRALGFVKNPQRMNVLLSRARQKLVLATSRRFIADAVNGIDPDGVGSSLDFLRTMLAELERLANEKFDGAVKGVEVIDTDEQGTLRL